ncbi:MAG: hypothetical protein HC821_03030 [Lewinella sp.]|nr:hypothetical protein [Lewinella sp.]
MLTTNNSFFPPLRVSLKVFTCVSQKTEINFIMAHAGESIGPPLATLRNLSTLLGWSSNCRGKKV